MYYHVTTLRTDPPFGQSQSDMVTCLNSARPLAGVFGDVRCLKPNSDTAVVGKRDKRPFFLLTTKCILYSKNIQK